MGWGTWLGWYIGNSHLGLASLLVHQVQIFRTLWENHLRQSSEKQISIQKNITFVFFIIEGVKVCYAVMAQLFTVNPDLSGCAEWRILVKLHS